MKKIMIMGCPGSGKTRFAKKIGKITNIRVYQIKDDTLSVTHSKEEKEAWKKAVEAIVLKKEWIIEGTQSITFETRMKEADTVIFIDEKLIKCVFGFIKKTFLNYLYRKPYTIRFSFTMIKKILRYNKETKPLIQSLVEKNKDHIEYISLQNDIQKLNFLKDVRELVKT